MAARPTASLRIEDLEREATTVLSEIGLTVPDVVRLLLARIVEERRLPFDLKPNELTAETLRRSERGEDVFYAEDAAVLFRDLEMLCAGLPIPADSRRMSGWSRNAEKTCKSSG